MGEYRAPKGRERLNEYFWFCLNHVREYNKAIREGKTDDEAVRRAIRLGSHGLILSERGMLGYMTAGAYSNADLVANFMGMCFYRNLTGPVMLKGFERPVRVSAPVPRLVPGGDVVPLDPGDRLPGGVVQGRQGARLELAPLQVPLDPDVLAVAEGEADRVPPAGPAGQPVPGLLGDADGRAGRHRA